MLYDFPQLEADIAPLSDFSVNKTERLQTTFNVLREHYVKLSTIAGRLKARTMLLSTAAGRKEYGFTKEAIEDVFEKYETIRGYLELLDKTTVLMQSITKHTPEM